MYESEGFFAEFLRDRRQARLSAAGLPAGQRPRGRGGPPPRGHGAGGDPLLGLRLGRAGSGAGPGGGAFRRGGGGGGRRLGLPLPAHLRRLQCPALGGRGGLPAVPRRARRHVLRRGRGRPGAGAPGAGAGAGRHAPGNTRGRGRLLRRPSHDGAGPLRRRRRRGALGGPGGRRGPGARGGGLHQRPRHRHAAQRRRRMAGAAACLRRAGGRDPSGGHQGADRPSAGLLRSPGGGGHGAVPSSRRAASGAGRRGRRTRSCRSRWSSASPSPCPVRGRRSPPAWPSVDPTPRSSCRGGRGRPLERAGLCHRARRSGGLGQRGATASPRPWRRESPWPPRSTARPATISPRRPPGLPDASRAVDRLAPARRSPAA